MEEIFKTWTKPLERLWKSAYFGRLVRYLDAQYELSRYKFNPIKIYPAKRNVFKCFNCDFKELRVVFIGTKPYDDYSEGLAFDSSEKFIQVAPGAEVIRQKIEKEFHNGFNLVHDYSLENLMEQNVLLINEELTTSNLRDHKELWREFVVEIITTIQNHHTGIIFCVEKNSSLIDIIDVRKQYILEYEDPTKFIYNPGEWDFSFQTVNDIIEHCNGEEFKLNF